MNMTDPLLASIDLSDITAPPKVVTCTIEGSVEPEDIARLLRRRGEVDVPAGSQPGDLKKIRERHHALARYVASGMQNGIIAQLVGLTEQYVSTLLAAPAMQQLIAYYRSNHINATQAVSDRLKHVALKAVDELEVRLDDGELDSNALLSMAKLGLDRSGHGPSSKVTAVTEHHLIDHAELARLNREARKDSAEHILNAQYTELPAISGPSGEQL